MTRYFGPTGVLAALVLALPAGAADNKKDPPATDATAKDYQALTDAHTATGKLVSVGGSDKSLNLRIDYQILQPNPNAAKGNNPALQRLLREQQEIMRTRNPFQQAVRLQKLQADILREQARETNNAYKVVAQHKDFDLESIPDVVVRYQDPPVEYDDKGNLKKYTAAELKEMKGKNPDLPGYTADFDKLRPDQTVKVTVVKPKADKEKDKDAPKDEKPEVKKPQVKMIVIVAEAPETTAPAKGKKKK